MRSKALEELCGMCDDRNIVDQLDNILSNDTYKIHQGSNSNSSNHSVLVQLMKFAPISTKF